eukprot:jgi/Galph1/4612/GphlegSOOS_G3315.1
MNNTYFPDRTYCNREQKWYVVDAKNKTLGRLSTEIAAILLGKNKTFYTPYMNTGDHVIVINSSGVNMLSGDKKIYYRNSKRPGSLKKESFYNLKSRLPNRIIEHSVKGMLPKNKLGRILLKNLKVYSGKRKSAIAQVLIKEVNNMNSSAKMIINNEIAEKYLQYNPIYLNKIYLPLTVLNNDNKFNIIVKVKGGGLSAQADAIKLGLARILCSIDKDYRPLLKKYHLLTRDSRIKERRKYGLKKARKAPQYSKR